MSKLYIKKSPRMNFRWMVRLFGLFLSLSGIITMGYFFFPIISWQLYLAPVFAAENIATPIPKATVLNQGTFASLARQTTSLLLGVNYYNAATWFPSAPAPVENAKPQVTTYRFSVPKLKIVNAIVSTVDSDLASHSHSSIIQKIIKRSLQMHIHCKLAIFLKSVLMALNIRIKSFLSPLSNRKIPLF
jgi:sortase A